MGDLGLNLITAGKVADKLYQLLLWQQVCIHEECLVLRLPYIWHNLPTGHWVDSRVTSRLLTSVLRVLSV